MKPYKIVIFILFVFSLLAAICAVFPQDGVQIGTKTFKFPSLNEVFAVEQESTIDINANVELLKAQTDVSGKNSILDSLSFYRNYVRNNVARIYFPKDNYKYYDTLFAVFERAKTENKTVHILHYGDSQIEMDRITSLFRHELQQKFGGQGVGMLPAIQTIPTFTVRQTYSGALSRYVVYGDTSQPRASHKRYGLLANLGQVCGQANVSVSAYNTERTYRNTQNFSRVVLLLGNNGNNFSATCMGKQRSIASAYKGVSRLEWTSDKPINKTTVSLNGTAEIYALSVEGTSGVCVTNVPMRGCSGTIFTRMDSSTLANAYQTMNVKLIILQYGGNMMPQINSQKAIDAYMERLAKQIKFIQHCNPQAKILFIGPSDMSKRINGKMQTYPYLPDMNEALKKTALANGAAYWDMFHVMGGENSMVSWVKHSPAWAGGDYVHFTEKGANEIAQILANSFLTHYEFYRLRKTCPKDMIDKFMKMQ